jgi:DNA-directed RNA polymerase subunit beta'
MAVHIPLSLEAQAEARMLMLATNNILLPATGKPAVTPTQDMVLGLYYLTLDNPNATKGAGMRFFSFDDALAAFEANVVHIHAKINVRESNGDMLETTPGRIIFNQTVRKALA